MVLRRPSIMCTRGYGPVCLSYFLVKDLADQRGFLESSAVTFVKGHEGEMVGSPVFIQKIFKARTNQCRIKDFCVEGGLSVHHFPLGRSLIERTLGSLKTRFLHSMWHVFFINLYNSHIRVGALSLEGFLGQRGPFPEEPHTDKFKL